MFQGIPRWVIVFGIVVIAGIELVSRLPDILLIPQRLAGMSGEFGAKAIQAPLVTAQTQKTENEAQLAEMQAKLAQVQADKTAAEKRLADAQTNKTNLDSAQTALGLAVTGALIAGGVKVYQALHGDDQQNTGQNTGQTTAQPSSSSITYATVTAQNLNLRSGPATTFSVIVIMPQGTRVKVVRAAEDGWFEVEVAGEGAATYRGFANGKLLAAAQ